MAADLPVKAPVYKAPAVAPYSWTGFYVGLNGGYAAGHASPSQSLSAPNCDGPICPNLVAFVAANAYGLNPHGFTGGAQAGYNYQMGNTVFGLEVDVNSFHLNRSFAYVPTLVASGFPITVAAAGSTNSDWLITLRARLGYAAGNLLAYATGGAAFTNQNYSQTMTLKGTATSAVPGTFNTSVSDRIGWVLGVGAEYALPDRWSIKAEYLHLDFGTTSSTVAIVGPPIHCCGYSGSTLAFSSKFTADIGRVGVNRKF